MIGDRIKEVRNTLKLTQFTVSEKLNINQGNYSRIEKNIHEPNMSFLHFFSKIYNVNLNWLISGEGEMFLKNNSDNNIIKEPAHIYNNIRVNSQVSDIFNNTVVNMPVVAEISAGYPMKVYELPPKKYIPINIDMVPNPNNYFLFRVNGDSMYPEIFHGDYVIINKVYDIAKIDGQIVAVRNDEGITLKRILVDDLHQQSILLPVNENYRPILLDDAHIILGVMTVLIREFI